MGLIDRMRRRNENDAGPPAKVVVAAAMPLAGPAVRRLERQRAVGGVEMWQKDAWYFYDSIGELRSPITRMALALSQATPYAATVDPDTGEASGATRSEDPRAQAAMRQLLGGAKSRAQILFLYVVAWMVSGESYIIVRSRPGQPDQWLALTGSKLINQGGSWSYIDPYTMERIQLNEGSDLLLRVFSPHPDDQGKADSAVRSALPILAEIEKTSQNIAARLDSRVASNGLLFLPEEADYPTGYEGQAGAGAWTAYLTDIMSTSLTNPGQASAQVPIVGVLPAEVIQSILHVDLSTVFDAAVQGLRESDMSRLAAALDMPKSTAEGTEAESNHWTAWQVEETTFKVYGQPLLERLSDSLTEHWFRPALIAMGMDAEEADRTIIAWDVTGIVQEPDQTDNVKWLWENVLVSDAVALATFGMTEDDRPDQEEYARRVLLKLVSVAPTLLSDPNVAAAVDLGIEIEPAAAGVSAPSPEAPPELEAAPAEESGAEARTVPDTRTDDVPDGLVAAAELLVYDALSRAGGRLLTRENRGQFRFTPKHELHTVINAMGRTEVLLADSFQFADVVAETFGLDAAEFRLALHGYASGRLVAGRAHDRDQLRKYLR